MLPYRMMNASRFLQRLWWPCVLVLMLASSGCSTMGYFAQSAGGQLNVLMRSKSIESLLHDESTPNELKQQLSRIPQIRRFAIDELKLPDNKAYTRYADLKREYVVWNVFATEEFSVDPVTWCFPIAGCIAYRGYFKQARAVNYAAHLKQKGFDVFVGGIPAYSTLGWFHDPVLNTVIDYPAAELAGLIFHELAHQVVYVKDDTTFNESFATAVELEGIKRWFETQNDSQGYRNYLKNKERDNELINLILHFRDRLASLYEQNMPLPVKRARKAELFQTLPLRYAELRQKWPGDVDFDKWFDRQWNNAFLIPFSAYYDYVPEFQRMIRKVNGRMDVFYKQVRRLATMDKQMRQAELETLKD